MAEIVSNAHHSRTTKTRARKSFQERKQCFRSLLNKVDDLEEKKDLGLQTVKEVGNILKEINELEHEYPIEQRVEQTDETLLDCMILSSSSNILVKCINALDISATSYEPNEFCNELSSVMSNGDDLRPTDLLKIIDEARTLIPGIYPYNHVYGDDMNKLRTPKPNKTSDKPKRVAEKFSKKEPEKVVSIDKSEEGIEEIVKEMYKVLLEEYTNHAEKPINYYDYVMDTSSFSNTVENVFYCSFLIRDGKAKLDLDNQNPTIQPITKTSLKKYREQEGQNFQIITTIGMGDWERYGRQGFLQKHKNSMKNRKK